MESLSADRTGQRSRATVPPFEQELGRYRLSFARTSAELDAVFALRFEVFNLELGEGLEESFATRRDRDPFDDACDHLMVTDVPTGAVIGTYRLQTCAVAEAGIGFYSATEFDLARLPAEVLADAIELGRACIAREHRSSRVLFLLWRGLAAYVLWNRKRYFFGCCSLTSQNPREGLAAYAWLERHGHVDPALDVHPWPAYACVPRTQDPAPREVVIPPLFGIYLRYGAKVCGPPAIDRFFGTIDFLALLDVHGVDPRTFEQFSGDGGAP